MFHHDQADIEEHTFRLHYRIEEELSPGRNLEAALLEVLENTSFLASTYDCFSISGLDSDSVPTNSITSMAPTYDAQVKLSLRDAAEEEHADDEAFLF